MKILLENDLLRESLGKAAQASVQHLTWSTVGDRLISFYANAQRQFMSAGNATHAQSALRALLEPEDFVLLAKSRRLIETHRRVVIRVHRKLDGLRALAP